MSREGEAYMPRALVDRVLASATDDVVLVGGQALAFWMDRFGVRGPGDLPAVSRDVGFFTRNAGNAAPLERFAKAIGGQARVLDPRAISALIGSAVAPADDARVYNVDLLHTVVGLEGEQLMANAIQVLVPGGTTRFRVLHPLDVLQSRNANLHALPEKQDALGQLQFRLAIEVARAFLEERIDALEREGGGSAGDRPILELVSVVDGYSRKDAARKNAKRYGIHLADAIPAWRIASPAFWEKQWPHLRERMSPGYAARCEEHRPA
jgi:hypothetical protein